MGDLIVRTAAILLLAGLALPSASLATPQVPNLGNSGKTVTLPDVVSENFPPDAPAGPFADLPSLAAGIPDAPGGPPEDHGSNPHDGTPPYGNAYGYYSHGNGSTPSVPEPAAALMLGVGLAGLAVAGRRRS